MKLNNLVVSLLFLPVSLLSESHDSTNARLLTPAQMKEDVLFFYNTLAGIHPNPYQVLDKEQYETKKQELLNKLNKPMTIYDFWIQMAQLHSFFDAHTCIAAPDNIELFLRNNKCFYIHFVTPQLDKKELFFAELCVPDSLKNKKILTINEVRSDSIFNKIASCVSHESPIYVKTSTKDLFPITYPLLYNQPQVLNIAYLDQGVIKNVRLTSSDFTSWDATCAFHYRDIYSQPSFLFQYNPKDKIALFEFNACSGDYGAYSESLINAIDSLHKYDIQHLFIDITQNLGGASNYVFLLLNYLNFPAWDKSSGQQYTYNNKVHLIQSNYTSSAAVTLSCYFKYYRLGTIIGEETGGLTASYSSAQMLTLPNSQLTMYCATTKTVDKGGQWDGHGVLPDVAYSMRETHRFESFTWGELKEMLHLMEK